MPDEITQEDIATAALQPSEIEGDAGRVKQRSIDELQKAQHAAAGSNAAGLLGFGLRIQKIKPGDCG